MKNEGKIINTKEIADLARIYLSSDELSGFEGDMEKVVAFAKKVEAAEAGSPFEAATLQNVARKDIPDQRTEREALLSAAPQGSVVDGFFSVLRVIE